MKEGVATPQTCLIHHCNCQQILCTNHHISATNLQYITISPVMCTFSIEFNVHDFFLAENSPFSIYTAKDRDLKVLCGDIFQLNTTFAGLFDAIWDCKAIIAVNIEDRERYAHLLMSLLKQTGRILMTTIVYDQSLHNECPFSMPPEMIENLFDAYCKIKLVENIALPTESKVCKLFDLPWATCPVLLLSKTL